MRSSANSYAAVAPLERPEVGVDGPSDNEENTNDVKSQQEIPSPGATLDKAIDETGVGGL